MAKVVEEINAELAGWIAKQPMFFVATAPSGSEGHVNLSPKGGVGTLAVLGTHRVAYLDLTGSGVETIAHLRDNGRITIMLCAYDGPPRICRLYGVGRVHTLGSDEYEALASTFPVMPGARAIIDVEVTRISSSCGYSVPRMQFVEERENLNRWARGKGEDELVEYRQTRNAESIDGLAGFPVGRLADQS